MRLFLASCPRLRAWVARRAGGPARVLIQGYACDDNVFVGVDGMLRILILAVCGAATAVTAVADQATITGRVVVTKALTKKRVTMPSYQLRGASVDPREPETSRKDPPVVDELSRVVIYLEGAGLASGTPTRDVTLTQRNQRFEPE